jgi:hypothetical protein
LESGAADIERQIEPEARRFDKTHDPGHHGFVDFIASDQAGVGKPILKIAHQRFGIVAEEN